MYYKQHERIFLLKMFHDYPKHGLNLVFFSKSFILEAKLSCSKRFDLYASYKREFSDLCTEEHAIHGFIRQRKKYALEIKLGLVHVHVGRQNFLFKRF